jgi:predicted RNase H-like nuclease (RuvC/YqgF family)
MTAQELTKEVTALKQQTALNTDACERAHDRLDAVEKEQKEQSRLLVVIERLTNGISSLNEKVECVDKKVDGLGCRITAIEQEPAGKWKQLSWAVLMIIVGAAVGYVLSRIGLKP